MQSIRYMTYVTMNLEQCADENRHQMNSWMFIYFSTATISLDDEPNTTLVIFSLKMPSRKAAQ